MPSTPRSRRRRPASRRGAGRPAGSDADGVRRRLLDAAQRLFGAQGYAGVGVRAIAEEAGVNPAMIHYYFGDKQGLYQAVLEDTLEPLFEDLRRWAETPDAERGSPRRFVEIYTRTIASNRWLPALIMREVLSEEGRLRERFVHQIALRAGSLLVRAIEGGQTAGRLRADLDPRLTALSLVSMTLFPFLAFPIAKEVFGVEMGDAYLDRLVEHTARMFLRGAAS